MYNLIVSFFQKNILLTYLKIRQFRLAREVNKNYFLEKKILLKKCLQGMCYLETKGNLIIKTRVFMVN